jgi:ABC-2 type transport system ATP-binding protein
MSKNGDVMIALRRLHRYYGSTRAVYDISFEVERGQVFGYIGPNGAGKTTSMRVLATLDIPTYGDAYIDGFSVVNDPDRVRRRLGYMPDAYGAYPNVNCYEYLDFYARAYGLVGRERHRAVRRVMGFTRLEPLAEKPMKGLSKGMKQRLCLGRALVHDPVALILDEPAAGLDPRARIELREMIRQLAADGKTVLISSHILTELAEMCDQVGIIEHGQLLATGTVAEIQHRHLSEFETPQSMMRASVVTAAEGLANWLSQRPDVGDIQILADSLVFRFTTDRTEQARLLRDIIVAGFELVDFGMRSTSLEDVFLKVTRGDAQ